MSFNRQKITEARNRSAMAAMVDIDTFLSALDDIEYLLARCIITDTNGRWCLLCDGQDLDGDGVFHRDGCPVNEEARR